MALWPADGVEDWNTTMKAYVEVSHDVNGKIKTEALQTDATAPVLDAALANKKYVDDTVGIAQMKADNVAGATYGVGTESSTEANGRITKTGEITVGANATGEVTYAAAFPGGVNYASATYKGKVVNLTDPVNVQPKSSFETTVLEVTNSQPSSETFYWQAIGY